VGNLSKRVLTALCFGPLIVFLFYILPAKFFFGLLALIAISAIIELSTISGIKQRWLIVLLAALSLVPLYMQHLHLFLLWLVCSPVFCIFFRVIKPGDDATSENQEIVRAISILFASIICIVLPMFFLYLLKTLNALVPLILLLTMWASDSCAYFLGVRFGKTKLVPAISPNKSYEGLLGAMLGGLISMVLFHSIMAMGIVESCCIGAFVGLLGQMGDILESAGKRVWGVKDSSGLIPGHGGILDRMDSFLFAAPFVFAYLSGFSR
jgi:phosphatidate cytidylyltransferase